MPAKLTHVPRSQRPTRFDSRVALCGRLVSRWSMVDTADAATCPKCAAAALIAEVAASPSPWMA